MVRAGTIAGSLRRLAKKLARFAASGGKSVYAGVGVRRLRPPDHLACRDLALSSSFWNSGLTSGASQ